MALFYECMLKYARKLLDTADIVREAILRQLSHLAHESRIISDECPGFFNGMATRLYFLELKAYKEPSSEPT